MSAKRRKPTVLIAEDFAPERYAMRRDLELNGYHVIEANDGADALALATDDCAAVDVVVTDYRMPRMDGLELRKRLEAQCPDLPVLMVSGLNSGELPDGRESIPFLRKPFEPEALLGKLQQMLPPPPRS